MRDKMLAGFGASYGISRIHGQERMGDFLHLLAFGAVTVGFTSFISIEELPKSGSPEAKDLQEVINQGRAGYIQPQMKYLGPEYLAAQSSIASSISRASFALHSPINPLVVTYALAVTSGAF